MKTYQFCWFWDSHCSIDVAAWMQAIGALVALGITVFLYRHQITYQRKQIRKSQIAAVNHFANMVAILFDEFQQTLDENISDRSALSFLGERMNELVRLSGTFNIDSFDQDEAVHFFRTRDAAHKISLWIMLFEPAQIVASKKFISDLAREIDADIEALINLDESKTNR